MVLTLSAKQTLQKSAAYLRSVKHQHFCPVSIGGQACGEWSCFGCGEGAEKDYLECDEHFMWWVRDSRDDYIQEVVRGLG